MQFIAMWYYVNIKLTYWRKPESTNSISTNSILPKPKMREHIKKIQILRFENAIYG